MALFFFINKIMHATIGLEISDVRLAQAEFNKFDVEGEGEITWCYCELSWMSLLNQQDIGLCHQAHACMCTLHSAFVILNPWF